MRGDATKVSTFKKERLSLHNPKPRSQKLRLESSAASTGAIVNGKEKIDKSGTTSVYGVLL